VRDLWPPPSDAKLSVFNVLNIFQICWFLSQDCLVKNIVLAQKDANGAFTWVEFAPQFYSYLIWSGLWLIPHSLTSPCPSKGCFKLVKKVLFMFILEVLLEVFYDVLKGALDD
jgi:hypothetical protein